MMFSIISNLCPFRTHKYTHAIYSYFSPKLSVSLPIFLAHSTDILFVLTLSTSLEMWLSKKTSLFQMSWSGELLH